MNALFPFLIYIASVLISWKYCAGYWVVGPVFAGACLFLQFKKLKNGFAGRHLFFIAASILVYALVYWIADKGWRLKPEVLDMLAGSFTGGVVLGSILMPVLHGMIFSIELKTVRKVALYLIASWYFTLVLSMLDDALNLPGRIDYTLVAIALWQGIYLKHLKVN